MYKNFNKLFAGLVIISLVTVFSMCQKPDNDGFAASEDGYDPRLSGGQATTFIVNSQAYGQETDGLDTRQHVVFTKGDGVFAQNFVSGHAYIYGGLGPIYINTSCTSCHHNEAKGAPTIGNSNSSLLIRLSIPGEDENGGPLGIPGFGVQLQTKSVSAVSPEGSVKITYKDSVVTYPDNSTVTLRVPTYEIYNTYTSLPAKYMMSARMAPMSFGLGLLENIPESQILANADPLDKDGDGISGKANYVYDAGKNKVMLGRFGWKANVASILVQVAAAANQDMGLTNYIFPQESSYGQSQFSAASNDDKLPDSLLNYLVFYSKTLAVPARRGFSNTEVLEGEALFKSLKCVKCHQETFQTGTDVTLKPISNQRIHPYTNKSV